MTRKGLKTPSALSGPTSLFLQKNLHNRKRDNLACFCYNWYQLISKKTIMRTRFWLGLFATFLIIPQLASAAYGDTSTYASKIYHGDGLNRLKAFFDFPEDIVVNNNGAFLIADTYNNVIRRIKPGGKVKTFAGTGAYGDTNDLKHKSEFAWPKGLDQANGVVYVADTGNDKIKKIKNGVVTTIASGLDAPEDVLVSGSTVFILDTQNNALKKVTTDGDGLTTVAGSLNDPKKMDITSDGGTIYVANGGTYQLKKVNVSSGAVTTVAGSGAAGSANGACDEARFENIWGVHVYDSETIYVSDGDGFDDTVRKVDLSGDDCQVTTFASDSNMVSINFPTGLTSYDGNLYVLATGIGIVQRYSLDDADDNDKFAGANRFNVKNASPMLTGNPKYMVLSKSKRRIYFSENNRIRWMPKKSGKKTAKLIAGSVIDNYNADDTEAWVKDLARFSDVSSFALSKSGKKLFVVDRNNNRIREVVIKTGSTSYLTGAGKKNLRSDQGNDYQNGDKCNNEFDTGVSGCAYFDRPMGSALSKSGKYLYVADSGNNAIRRVTVRGDNKGKVKTLAGGNGSGYTDATGTDAQFSAPIGLAICKSGKVLYVADRDNQVIRKVNIKTKAVTTLAGTGDNGYLDSVFASAQFSYPEWITRAKNGDLFVSEVGGQKIRVLDRSLGVVKLVSGSGDRGFANGARKTAEFNNPRGMLALGNNKLLVAELYTDLIRSIDISGEAPYTEAAPVITEADPSLIGKEWFSGNSAQIEVHGTGFRHGATAKVGSHSASVSVQSETSVVLDMPIAEMAAGYYTIRITNTDGQSYTKSRALSVTSGGLVPNTDYTP